MFRRVFITAIIAALAVVSVPRAAMAVTNMFYGIVIHVSMNNIKVQDPKTKQSLSFLIVPKFNKVFSANGKTTYQMTAIKAGRYVGVNYDQHFLGQRHANAIYLMNNANQRIGKQ
ncbi:MAG TPA: hypothetical protein VMS32_01010 [Verrucomicrobiae bacterium]|jgi:hypothetical protein|nr:hypothetical protein [Verrucomicrobiae bacterium]